MSNLEHLIENGLCLLNKGISYREWRAEMQDNRNWQDNENITIDNLWEICQYVIYVWDKTKQPEVVQCKYCKHRKTSDCPMHYTPYLLPDEWYCKYGEYK